MKANRLMLKSLCLFLLPFLAIFCKPRGRQSAGSNANILEVYIKDTSGSFEYSAGYQFLLEECGNNPSQGTWGQDNKLLFEVENIFVGGQCKLVIMDPAKADDENIKWINGRKGAIFWTQTSFTLMRGSKGQLYGIAELTLGSTSIRPSNNEIFTVIAPVSFEEEDFKALDEPIIAKLLCTPPIGVGGSLVSKEASSPNFKFLLSVRDNKEESVCSKIKVNDLEGVISPPYKIIPKGGVEYIIGNATILMKKMSH
ncbi:MAG: hypothetical protein HQK54_04995 [Oligoflexales bacterium]|nr:hypothetical protein [Oligoflexales bacterium]